MEESAQARQVPSVTEEPPSLHQDSTQWQLKSQHELARSLSCPIFHQGDFSMDSIPIHHLSPPDRSMSYISNATVLEENNTIVRNQESIKASEPQTSTSSTSIFTRSAKKIQEMICLNMFFSLVCFCYLVLWVTLLVVFGKEEKFKGDEKSNNLLAAFYFGVITSSTVGFGDFVPKSDDAKVITLLYIIFGHMFLEFTGRWTSLLYHKWLGKVGTKSFLLTLLSVLSMVIGGIFFVHYFEKLTVFEGLYMAIVSSSTVGYGDHSFTTKKGKFFSLFWIPFATFTFSKSVSSIVEFLGGQSNPQSISKAQYVVFSLMQSGKVDEKSIVELSRQFEDLRRIGKFSTSNVQYLIKSLKMIEDTGSLTIANDHRRDVQQQNPLQ